MNLLRNQKKRTINGVMALAIIISGCDYQPSSDTKVFELREVKKETKKLPIIEWCATKIQFQNYADDNFRPSVGFSIVIRNESDRMVSLPISTDKRGLFGTTFYLCYLGDTINLKCLTYKEIQISPFSSDSLELTIDANPYSGLNNFIFTMSKISENYKMVFLKDRPLLSQDSFYVFDQYISRSNNYQTIILQNSITSAEYSNRPN